MFEAPTIRQIVSLHRMGPTTLVMFLHDLSNAGGVSVKDLDTLLIAYNNCSAGYLRLDRSGGCKEEQD